MSAIVPPISLHYFRYTANKAVPNKQQQHESWIRWSNVCGSNVGDRTHYIPFVSVIGHGANQHGAKRTHTQKTNARPRLLSQQIHPADGRVENSHPTKSNIIKQNGRIIWALSALHNYNMITPTFHHHMLLHNVTIQFHFSHLWIQMIYNNIYQLFVLVKDEPYLFAVRFEPDGELFACDDSVIWSAMWGIIWWHVWCVCVFIL